MEIRGGGIRKEINRTTKEKRREERRGSEK